MVSGSVKKHVLGVSTVNIMAFLAVCGAVSLLIIYTQFSSAKNELTDSQQLSQQMEAKGKALAAVQESMRFYIAALTRNDKTAMEKAMEQAGSFLSALQHVDELQAGEGVAQLQKTAERYRELLGAATERMTTGMPQQGSTRREIERLVQGLEVSLQMAAGPQGSDDLQAGLVEDIAFYRQLMQVVAGLLVLFLVSFAWLFFGRQAKK